MLFTVVELTNNLESSFPIAYSIKTSLSSDSLLSTIDSFKSSCKLALEKCLPLQEGGLTALQLKLLDFLLLDLLLGMLMSLLPSRSQL